MSLKTAICNFLVNMGNALLRWFGEYSTSSPKEEQRIKQVVNIEVNGNEKPYVKMSDSVKNFITCDMSENDKISTLTQIALYEAAKVDPYRITIKDGSEWYRIHNGQVIESHKEAA